MDFLNTSRSALLAGLFTAGLILAPTSGRAETGLQLFEDNCATCHGTSAQGDERIAPPIFGVQNHYLGKYPEKEAFVTAVVDWVAERDEAKSLMPGAIQKFGVMPEVDISPEDTRQIAEFLFDAKFDQPGWYEEHYRAEHGEAPPSGGMPKMGEGHEGRQGMMKGDEHGKGHGKGQGMGQGMGQGGAMGMAEGRRMAEGKHNGMAGHEGKGHQMGEGHQMGHGRSWWQRLWGE